MYANDIVMNIKNKITTLIDKKKEDPAIVGFINLRIDILKDGIYYDNKFQHFFYCYNNTRRTVLTKTLFNILTKKIEEEKIPVRIESGFDHPDTDLHPTLKCFVEITYNMYHPKKW